MIIKDLGQECEAKIARLFDEIVTAYERQIKLIPNGEHIGAWEVCKTKYANEAYEIIKEYQEKKKCESSK